MNKTRSNTAPKKKSPWKGLLIAALMSLGVLLAIGTLAAIYHVEAGSDVCWKSGEVVIDGQPLTLPCSVEEFEDKLHTTVPEGKYSDVISEVTVDGSRCPIIFKVYLSDDGGTVNGIIADADTIGDRGAIVFPGGVTLDSDAETVMELYATEPLNIYHSSWSEDIVITGAISSGYRYVDRNSFEMEFCTLDGEGNEIFYCYIADE